MGSFRHFFCRTDTLLALLGQATERLRVTEQGARSDGATKEREEATQERSDEKTKGERAGAWRRGGDGARW